MLTVEPTKEMLAQWKQIFEENCRSMKPNRKSGADVDSYFREKYAHRIFNSTEFTEVVAFNITENAHSREKLPKGVQPNIRSYQTGNALVGIDLVSGEFHIESKCIEETSAIYDDLFAYRGLDAEDLKNCFLVAEYVKLTQR